METSILARSIRAANRRPRGFTLIELLVVIAIIAVLSPFCCRPCRPHGRRRVAASAGTTSSKSRLAAHNYHDVANTFPPAFDLLLQSHAGAFCLFCPAFPCFGYCHTDGNIHVWAERLLVYVEATTVYQKICMNAPIFSPA